MTTKNVHANIQRIRKYQYNYIRVHICIVFVYKTCTCANISHVIIYNIINRSRRFFPPSLPTHSQTESTHRQSTHTHTHTHTVREREEGGRREKERHKKKKTNRNTTHTPMHIAKIEKQVPYMKVFSPSQICAKCILSKCFTR